MVLLQAMMALPFLIVFLFIFITIFIGLFIYKYNSYQRRFHPENPKPLSWLWVLLLPIIGTAIFLAYFLSLPESRFSIT
jgi:nicotinamide riboside transporter PnuC